MKIDLILLASGSSQRFGKQNKLLYCINGKSMFLRTVELAKNIKEMLPEQIGSIYVVSCYLEIQEITQKHGLQFCWNTKSQEGIAASIRLGVRASNPENGLLFLVCDQPGLQASTIFYFLKGYLSSGKSLGCLCWSDGHMAGPCVFSSVWRSELLTLFGDKGGKKILRKNMKQVYLYPASDQELQDVDEMDPPILG